MAFLIQYALEAEASVTIQGIQEVKASIHNISFFQVFLT